MKINFDVVIKNLNGKPFTNPVTPIGKKPSECLPSEIKHVPVTLGEVCTNSLLAIHENEKLSGKEKYERWALAKKINYGGAVELTVEEIAKCKELIGKTYAALIVGPVFEILEHNEVKTKGDSNARSKGFGRSLGGRGSRHSGETGRPSN